MIRFTATALTALILAGAAFAGTEMTFPVFTGINVHGGGHVVLRHGAVQKVTVIKGDLSKIDLHVEGTTLDISPCKNWCLGSQPLDVEIVSPKIDALEIHGGGSIETTGQFPRQSVLNVQVHGGGGLDGRAIPAETVNAEIHGGGGAKVQALSAINANVHGGGSISYTGNPSHIASQAHGGGSISKE